jgi:para-aminobenzoate synthetase / 4-amino-4-deoxychorismate lyase
MLASAEWFGFSADARDLADALDSVAQPAEISRLRLLLDRHGAVGVTVTALTAAPDIVRLALDHQVVRSDDVFCLHKTTNRAVYEDAASRHPGADDVILVNERGEVVETTVANLLYRLGDDWFTPPLSSGGLNGIGRAIELDEGRVTERVLFASELAECDELAVVSSLRGRRRAVLYGST